MTPTKTEIVVMKTLNMVPMIRNIIKNGLMEAYELGLENGFNARNNFKELNKENILQAIHMNPKFPKA
tara:strand:- start:1052 stop:1255 length:204 start_codon:yes stop_codon:yes gene_type:complete